MTALRSGDLPAAARQAIADRTDAAGYAIISLDEFGIGARLDERIVERSVEGLIAAGIEHLRGLGDINLMFEALDRGAAIARQRDAQSARLEHFAQFANVAQVGDVILKNESAALRAHRDETLGLEAKKRLAHRRAADAKLFSQSAFRELFAERQPARHDQFANFRDHHFGQRTRPRQALQRRIGDRSGIRHFQRAFHFSRHRRHGAAPGKPADEIVEHAGAHGPHRLFG